MADDPRMTRLEYCQKQAAEARARAENMRDAEAKSTMERVTAMWDAMAAAEDRRLRKVAELGRRLSAIAIPLRMKKGRRSGRPFTFPDSREVSGPTLPSA